MPKAETIADRKAIAMRVVQDPDITLKEGLLHIYHWYKWERARIKMNRASLDMFRQSKKLDEMQNVLYFRKQLKKF